MMLCEWNLDFISTRSGRCKRFYLPQVMLRFAIWWLMNSYKVILKPVFSYLLYFNVFYCSSNEFDDCVGDHEFQ